MKGRWMAAAVLAALAPPAVGTLPARAGTCGADATQLDLDECADRDFKAADAALNATYGKIMARLEGDAATRKLLVSAQKAWLGFRDAECAFAASGSVGGSAHPMVVAGCRAEATAARDKRLATYLACGEGDLLCPTPSH